MKEESSVESASTTADRRNSITRPISRSPFSSHPQTFQFLALAVQNGLSDTNSPSTNSFPAPQQLLTSSVQHVEGSPTEQLSPLLQHNFTANSGTPTPTPTFSPLATNPFMNLVHSTRTNTHHPDTDKYLSLNNLNETTESLSQ
ncbi:hypothetical protein BLNAU_21334 [Blattamonas nauphoetae]|uniref:Uncharacterized protein n=1 Tax=Blattamonas nauphoetae TaxID=2049346 RepID=A0ABQ9WW50_9EUKA|nr:hypothetical protein BLNAU_21334 [Blattamonas nauphoetae]